jgi:serine/threonine protein kinase
MIASSSNPIAAFHRIDPDTLCLACLHQHGAPGGCSDCGFDEGAAVSSPLHLPLRTILHGQYLVGRALGQGGFGITYLAWDLNLEMPVAIKEFLPTDFASRASAQLSVTPYGEDGATNFDLGLDAFEGEARTLARCNALAGVVDVLNYFRENGTGYIVMHYLRGRTLRDYLRARGAPLPYGDAAALVRPVLEALREVHRLGLVHRDISPDNIYICDSGRVCLLDFGAARNAVRDRSKSLSVQFKVGYTPEEQYRRHGAQGPWTDIYAAAATFYRALTGLTPPPSLDRLSLDQLCPPGKLGVSIPRRAERALMRALAVQAGRRYRTIDEFLDDLGWPAASVSANANPRISDDRAGATTGATGDRRDANGGNDAGSIWDASADRGGNRGDDPGRDRGLDPGADRGPTSGAVLRDAALHDMRRHAGARGTSLGAHHTSWRAAIAVIADGGRLMRLWLDGALARARARAGAAGGAAGRERAIREQLAALWPVTLVGVTLRAPHLPAGPDHGPLDVYARDETASIAFGVVLQSNYAGIRPLSGSLRVAVIDPRRANHSDNFLELSAPDFVDRVALEGAWSPEEGFDAGVWRFDFLWDGRKIGEREFVISA